MKGPFTDLIVWQKAMELVKAVYALSKAFPADERYALTDQIRRAACSELCSKTRVYPLFVFAFVLRLIPSAKRQHGG